MEGARPDIDGDEKARSRRIVPPDQSRYRDEHIGTGVRDALGIGVCPVSAAMASRSAGVMQIRRPGTKLSAAASMLVSCDEFVKFK